ASRSSRRNGSCATSHRPGRTARKRRGTEEEVTHAGEKEESAAPPAGAPLVAAGDRAQRRARSGEPGVHAQPAADRAFAEAIRGAQQSAQVRSVPLGHVHADLLRESRRPEPERCEAAQAAPGEGRVAQTLRALAPSHATAPATRSAGWETPRG